MSEIPESYDPDSIEPKWRDRWRESDVYAYEDDPEKPDYVIDTPPPYPTGNLHIGNALGWCYMDFAARYSRLRGYDVDFPQGWDCHGLPTEVKVEENRGIHRTDVPREEFREMCIEHTEGQIEAMRETMHTLGLSQDWTHEYFTMDPEYWGLTQRSFVEMADSGYVYRDEHPVNWCPRCETAIADAEVEPADRQGTLYYITFPGVGTGRGASAARAAAGPDAGSPGGGAGDGTEEAGEARDIEIATTRPELLPACVSMAVHPDDERYEGRAGETFEVPLFGQEVELVADPAVDPDFGTGAVMICTFGDKQDVEWWGDYDLGLRTVFTPDGHLTDAAGEFAGLGIEEAETAVADALADRGYLNDSEPTEQSVGTCWRCDTPIEILSTEQWFVTVDQEEILEYGREVEWIPEHMYGRLEEWTRGMDWDWVISRQRVFATPIPAWHCEDCGYTHIAAVEEVPVDPTDEAPAVDACPDCGGEEWTGETDVMDTWMDSSITPLYVQGWPDAEFEPTSLREQGHDIIRTWAFYTILRVGAVEDDIPWEEALINGMVFGDDGHKMSKSRGNFVQPESVVEEYSADAFRQAIALGGQPGADIQFQWKEVESASRFGTKLWNITRFASGHLDEGTPEIENPAYRDTDRWIRAKCARVAATVAGYMDEYRFDAALRELREFVWHDLADDYLELVKGRLYEGRPGERDAARYALYGVLTASLRMLAPFAPFTTEEAWRYLPTSGSVHAAAWPEFPEAGAEPGPGAEPEPGPAGESTRASSARTDSRTPAERRGQLVADVASAVRSWKSDRGIPLNTDVDRVEVYLGEVDGEPVETIDTYDLSSAVNGPVYLEDGRPNVELVPVDVEVDHSIVGPAFRERADAVLTALDETDPADVRAQLETDGEVEVEIGGEAEANGASGSQPREVVTVGADALTVREEHRAGGEAVEVLDVEGATVLVFP